MNRLRIEAGEKPLKSRQVGVILKNLGVKTASLGSWGRGIELTAHFRRKAHALARQFGITRRDITNWIAVKAGYAGPSCDLCGRFDLLAGLQPAPAERKQRRAKLFSEPDLVEVQGPLDDEWLN